MSTIPCPVCLAETYDGLVCRDCMRKVRGDLYHLPYYWRVLDDVLARQDKRGGDGTAVAQWSSGKGETPVVYNLHASKVRTYVWSQFTSWVRELNMGDARNLAPNMRAVCGWLAARTERMRGHAAADELYEEIRYCASLVRRAVDLPPETQIIGTCDVCGKTLHAPPGAAEVTCRECSAVIDVAPKRATLLARVGEALVTRHVALRVLAKVYGVEVKDATFRQWVHRGRITKSGDDRDGRPLYRVADLADLVAEPQQPEMA